MFSKPTCARNALRQMSQPVTISVRGKRTKSKGLVSPALQRVVTQLSVMSAGKKQPRMLKLSREDLIKHQVIQRCWATFQQESREKQNDQMRAQYKSAEKAMHMLREIDTNLYNAANANEAGKRFPLEIRIPTEHPPSKIWNYNLKKKT
ncbi:LAMI_0G10638g1_1 [Lachancea mirantina]|uniref:Large ribosomal subunit protein mL40 n=1 Tax=Lachancea mirantina TaxID=1230905 RepID=A0A1G4KAY5_9SACH|nr:LAMI_0G10638g1_1 [Lachancea mirantina]